jgi:hypothetical protein
MKASQASPIPPPLPLSNLPSPPAPAARAPVPPPPSEPAASCSSSNSCASASMSSWPERNTKMSPGSGSDSWICFVVHIYVCVYMCVSKFISTMHPPDPIASLLLPVTPPLTCSVARNAESITSSCASSQ